jgi:hypothetical protein
MVQVNAKIEINLMLEPSIVKIQHSLHRSFSFLPGSARLREDLMRAPPYVSPGCSSGREMRIIGKRREVVPIGIFCIELEMFLLTFA